MASKGFCIKIYFDLNTVSCPGVWLCPNGTVALRINSLNSHIESQKLVPTFPLTFDDKFLFKKTFTNAATLSQLQYNLEDEYLYAELIQWPSEDHKGVILATFESNLADLLYPAPCYKGLISGIDIDLLMEPSKYFPGIISPKIEILTRTVIEEIELCQLDMIGSRIINPKLINSKERPCIHRKRPPVGIIRQKRVCHTQPRKKISVNRCACGHDIHTEDMLVPYPSSQRSHVNQCYQKSDKDLKSIHPLSYQLSDVCSSQFQFHDFDDCPVCLQYKNYFKQSKSNATYSVRSDGSRRQAYYEHCNVDHCSEHCSRVKSSSTLRERMRHLRSN